MQCNSWTGEEISTVDAVQAFRYFVIDQSVILGILEEPLGNDQDPQPTVTVLIRCPSNKAAWTLQLRHLPRHKSGQVQRSANPGRPMAMDDQGTRNDSKPNFFPDSIDRIPLCAADRSIPAVESIAGDERAAMELDRLSRLMESQADLEKDLDKQASNDQSYHVEFECSPPEPCTEFQTARLILSHLGFLSIPALKAAVDSPVPRLVALENDGLGFVQDLEALDRLSPRTHDTILAYYVRAGQHKADQIISNALYGDLTPLYLELLASLGWPVQVASHPGWTGDTNTSWKVLEADNVEHRDPGPARFNGEQSILYWADVDSELAIVVPSHLHDHDTVSRPSSAQGAAFLVPESGSGPNSGAFERGSTERNSLKRNTEKLERAPTSLSLELDQEAMARRKFGRTQGSGGGAEQKVVLVWLESMEDADSFPLGDLVSGVNNVCLIIFIHPLASGLLRVKLSGHIGK